MGENVEITRNQDRLPDAGLLSMDLASRVPYGVKLDYCDRKSGTHCECTLIATGNRIQIKESPFYCSISDVKPYLRSVSKITKDEKASLRTTFGINDKYEFERWTYGTGMASVSLKEVVKFFDWLNSHHIDYRNLIRKGLAIEAPENMYELK